MEKLKILANGRLMAAVCAMLGIEASSMTDTALIDFVVGLIQNSSEEIKGLLRVGVVLAYAWYQHPVAVKKPSPQPWFQHPASPEKSKQPDGPAVDIASAQQ